MAKGGLVFSALKLVCSDGRVVDLLSKPNGILLKEWRPSIAPARGGGVYSESSLADGRKLIMRKLENAVETFNLTVRGNTQDDTIEYVNDLIDLLETGVAFWTTKASQTPVWIEAQGPLESGKRYAVIRNYTLSDLDNPFAQPFFGAGCNYAMDNIVVAIERGDWLDTVPEQPDCIPIDSNAYNSVDRLIEYPAANGEPEDDCYTQSPATIYLNSDWLRVGELVGGQTMDIGLRFYGLDIPQGSTILSASIILKIRSESNNRGPRSYRIYGEDANSNSTFSTYADYSGRSRTGAFANWNRNEYAALPGTKVETPSLKNIVQEIIDRAGWVSNNHMGFFIQNQNSGNGCWTEFWSWDYYNKNAAIRAGHRPQLSIVWTGERGVEAACYEGGYVLNSSNQRWPIDHVFMYDASGPTWTELIQPAGGLPTPLFPAVPNAADFLYFGASLPFNNIIFDITTANSDLSAFYWDWEYSLGGGIWSSFFPTWHLIDDTEYFSKTGLNKVQFDAPSDWVGDTVNTFYRYWIRLNVSAYGGGAIVPQQGNREIYTVRWSGVSVHAEDVTGTMSALANVQIWGESGYPIAGNYPYNSAIAPGSMVSRLYVVVSPETRFPDYDPYINLNTTNPNQIGRGVADVDVYAGASGYCTFIANAQSSTRRLVQYAPAGAPRASTKQFWVRLFSTGYFGMYHAFIRARPQTNADVGEFGLKIRTYAGYIDEEVHFETPVIYNKLTAGSLYSPTYEVYDMGIVPIPADSDRERQSQLVPGSSNLVDVFIQCATGADNLLIHDIVLIPVFESVAFCYTDHADYAGAPGALSLWTASYVSIESASDLRQTSRVQVRNKDDGQPHGDWDRSISGPFTFHAGVDQKIFVFGFGNTINEALFTSNYDTMYSMRARATKRYFGMRGQR